MLVMDRVDMEEVPERCAILLVVEDDEPYGLLLLHRSRQKPYRLRISFGLASLEDRGHRARAWGLVSGPCRKRQFLFSASFREYPVICVKPGLAKMMGLSTWRGSEITKFGMQLLTAATCRAHPQLLLRGAPRRDREGERAHLALIQHGDRGPRRETLGDGFRLGRCLR